jgi:hypothetical protein
VRRKGVGWLDDAAATGRASGRPEGIFPGDWPKIALIFVKKPNLLAYFRRRPHMSGFGSFLR